VSVVEPERLRGRPLSALVVTLIIVVVVACLVRAYTGTGAFVFTWASGLIRLLVGCGSAGAAYLLMTYSLARCGRLCPYELVLGPFMASAILAIGLIPLGLIQMAGALLKKR
jgi:hypothetical protein